MNVYSNAAYTATTEDITQPKEMLDSNVEGRLHFMRQNRGLGFAFIMMAMIVIGRGNNFNYTICMPVFYSPYHAWVSKWTCDYRGQANDWSFIW